MDYSLPGSSIHGTFQPRILGWVAISFSRGSSWPRDRTQVSRTAGRFFTIWATREALVKMWYVYIYRQWSIIQPQKEWNLVICNKTDELGGHYAKWNKSDRERLILYDLICMWNLKQKQTKTTDIENRLTAARGTGWRVSELAKGVKSTKSSVETSPENSIQHSDCDYHSWYSTAYVKADYHS